MLVVVDELLDFEQVVAGLFSFLFVGDFFVQDPAIEKMRTERDLLNITLLKISVVLFGLLREDVVLNEVDWLLKQTLDRVDHVFDCCL